MKRVQDKGYAWVVLAASTCGFTIQGSVLYTMTLMYQALLYKFQMTAADTGSLGAAYMLVTLMSSPVVTILSYRISFRTIVMIGGTLYMIGFLIMAFAVSSLMVLIGYGLLAGFANNLFIVSATVMITQYFNKKRSLAMGIGTAGLSAGSLIFPPILEILLLKFGFSGAIMLHSGILFNLVVVGALFAPIEEEVCITREVVDEENEDYNKYADKCNKMINTTGLYHFRSALYLAYTLLAGALFTAWVGGLVYMSGLAKEQCGLANEQIAIILSIGGGTDIVGKLVSGFLFDLKAVRSHRVLIFIFLNVAYASALLLTAVIAKGYVTMAIGWALFIMLLTTTYTQSLVVLADIVGVSAFTGALANSRVFQGIASFAGTRVAGQLADSMGSYVYAFYFLGGVVMCSSLVFTIVYICVKQHCFHKHDEDPPPMPDRRCVDTIDVTVTNVDNNTQLNNTTDN